MLKTPQEQFEIIMKGVNTVIDEAELLSKLERSYNEQHH